MNSRRRIHPSRASEGRLAPLSIFGKSHASDVRTPSYDAPLARACCRASSASPVGAWGSFDDLVGDGEHAVGGMLSPSTLAVLRLMTSSNLADCTTGRSAGFSALENSAGVKYRSGDIKVGQAGSVAHQTAAGGELALFIDRRKGNGVLPAPRFARAGC